MGDATGGGSGGDVVSKVLLGDRRDRLLVKLVWVAVDMEQEGGLADKADGGRYEAL